MADKSVREQIKYILIITIAFISMLTMCSCGKADHLSRDDWSPDVKEAVNDFIDMYGEGSENYNVNSYVVSDFDNTASIFDMCDQFIIYQAEVMGYAFTPDELPDILSSGLGDMDEDLSIYGYGSGSYNDWISDIVTAYTYLYENYGPFDADGLDEKTASEVREDPMWAEFTAKMMNMYLLIGDNESTDVSYPWVTYWFTGMTEDEIYDLAREADAKYGKVNTSKKTITTSDEIDSKVGPTEYTYTEGAGVTENTKELWRALNSAGIDVWVCSASDCDIIRAAIDEFGLHDYCTGLIGMTPAENNGKITYAYDYDTGYAWYAADDGWERGETASGAQTQGTGKVTAIQNICVKEYGCGPLAGFMDSTGDYNFCTEFNDLKLVICFNRANRKVTDGGSVIAELAMYQKDVLDYDLRYANENGDTLYVLQGRDENGKRTLRNSNKTIQLGQTEEKLYCDEKNQEVYDYMAINGMTTEDIVNKFAIKTDENSSGNVLGFDYGFLENYDGYHTKSYDCLFEKQQRN